MIQDAAGPFGDHQYGYGLIFLAIPFFPLLLIVGTAVAQTAAVRARRRALAGASPDGDPRTRVAEVEAAPRG
ncbi:MAG TPA: hypothetical protein VHG28_09630 [Longimicrobiaceae bacterium]|nr:hypothetical protein [Longimicrobiaceae bacterium]